MEKKVIVSEKSPAAIGPYSQAIEYNGIVYTSGVIGVNPATGEVGETIEEQTTQVFEKLKGTSCRRRQQLRPGNQDNCIY